jgi:uncharacterized protein YfiM (DUF2279 family)
MRTLPPFILLVTLCALAGPARAQRLETSPAAGRLIAPIAIPEAPAEIGIRQEQARVDAWFAQDKVRHFFTSYAAAAFIFGAATAADLDSDTGMAVSIGTAGVLGVGKEVHDRRRGGWFSVRDLVADALGLAAAYVTLRQTY